VPAVFSDTGLEYPEIRDFVKMTKNVITVRPKMPFHKVIEKYGYPVASKKISRAISDLQNETERNKNACNLYRTGLTRNGTICLSRKLPKKWFSLVNAPFKCSEKCCDVMKKEPLHRFEKETGLKAFVGTMAVDSRMREKTYLANGCNAFNSKINPISTPMGFWLEEDVWAYIKKYDVPYSKIYDMGEKRTGCMFCMFGVHLEKGENRFQRMAKLHPKQYDYCINKLGIGKVLEYIGVPF
jgi:3'-phosphoadenosine 5'-phosphosulfate sulfotransferase (PAPS reductase)/FAD synthetase